jgi:HlyD family secretion protein
MKKRNRYLIVTGILLILVNISLLFFKDDSIKRYSIVSNWEKIKERDIERTTQTTGKITPAKEHYIYFDQELGSFQKFLVDEETKVQIGTPLFEYVTDNNESVSIQLQEKINQLTEGANSLSEYITQLNEMVESIDEENKGAKVAIEAEILQREHEWNVIQAEITSLTNQLTQLGQYNPIITVSSPVEGIVRSIDYSLHQPIMTIVTDKRVVQGYLTENQLNETEVGMPVRIKYGDESFEGEIRSISQFRDDEKSGYAVQYAFNNQEATPIFDREVKVEIIQEAKTSVPSVRVDSVLADGKWSFVWQINKKGQIIKQKVEKGITNNQFVEINGINLENPYIIPPGKNIHEGRLVQIPIPLSHIKKLSKLDIKNPKKELLYGLFAQNRFH